MLKCKVVAGQNYFQDTPVWKPSFSCAYPYYRSQYRRRPTRRAQDQHIETTFVPRDNLLLSLDIFGLSSNLLMRLRFCKHKKWKCWSYAGVKLIQLLDIRLWGVCLSGNIPCIAHTELEPVGIWCIANRHILECAILDVAWGRKPLHVPPTISIKVEVNVAIATFRTAAKRNICQLHLVWSCTEWSRCLMVWPYNVLGSVLHLLGRFLTENISVTRAEDLGEERWNKQVSRIQ